MTDAEWKLVDVDYRYTKDNRKRNGKSDQIIKALEGVSFNQPYGEVVGIIGGKGAGKSTLIQLLMGEAEPTKGTVSGSHEHVAFLELPNRRNEERTGENYVRSQLLKTGTDRKKISKIIGNIQRFSELGSTFKKKLREYSTEEKIQLQLSIIVFSTPTVIYIDESLLMIKEHFYIKFYLALLELKELGSSVWIETDNLRTVTNYCDKGVWLEFGKLKKYGKASDVIAAYQRYYNKIEQMSSQEQQYFWEDGYNQQLINEHETVKNVERSLAEKEIIDQQATIVLETAVVQKIIEETQRKQPVDAATASRSSQRKKKSAASKKRVKGWEITSLFLVCFLLAGIVFALKYPFKEAVAPASTKRDKVYSQGSTSSSTLNETSSSSLAPAKTSSEALPVQSSTSEAIDLDKETYTVKTGETLSELAERFNVSISQLREWNNLATDDVQIGSVINIKGPQMVAEGSKLKASQITHKVEPGQSLTEIAEKYHVTVADLKTINQLNDMTIYAGTVLALPEYAEKPVAVTTEPTSQSTEAPPEVKEHVVVKGETLYAIARKYNVDVMSLQAKNSLQTEQLYLGQVILIP